MPIPFSRVPLISIDVSRERIQLETISPSRAPDEKWRFVDKAGHGHFWADGGLPTLAWVVTGTRYVGDEEIGDEIEDGEWRCIICQEVVEPGMSVKYEPSFIEGPTIVTVAIDEERFRLNEAQYCDSINVWREALRKLTG